MSNNERIQARIARDKARKMEKRRALVEEHGTAARVFTMQHLFLSFRKRLRGVSWKGTVQKYAAHAIVKMKRAKDGLLKGIIDVSQSVRSMVIYERGKRRPVRSVLMDCRVIQGVICDNSISPLISPSLIYDNPASSVGKGVSFTRKRNLQFMIEQIKESGKESFALVWDLHNFFGSIRHKDCRARLKAAGQDELLQQHTMTLIKMYHRQDIEDIKDPAERARKSWELDNDEAVGATLGSQISQDMALVVPNPIDHMIKDELGCKRAIRFMDDGIIYHRSKEFLNGVYARLKEACTSLGFELNEKKTHIFKLSKGLSYLKIRYRATDTGGIIRKIAHESVVRMRRKLKKFAGLVRLGKMTLDNAFASFMSWFGNAKRIAATYISRKSMLKLYNKLFHCYRTEGMIA